MPGVLGGNSLNGKATAKTDGAYRTWGGVAPEGALCSYADDDR
jgi:hypothetical protein